MKRDAIFNLFLCEPFAHFIRAASPICTASSIGTLSLYNNGESTNRWRDKSRQSVDGRERKRESASEGKRETKEAGDRAERCIIVTFTLGQVRSIVMDKLYGREEQAGASSRLVALLRALCFSAH